MSFENEIRVELSDRIEPNLSEILREFNKLLKEKYGISRLAVVEFRVDKLERFEELILVSPEERRGCWDCGLPIKCCGLVKPIEPLPQ